MASQHIELENQTILLYGNDINIQSLIDLLNVNHKKFNTTKKKLINFTLVQPNWYAQLNKDEVILDFNEIQMTEINRCIKLLESYWYSLFMHFTCPPLCILNYPESKEYYSQLLIKSAIKIFSSSFIFLYLLAVSTLRRRWDMLTYFLLLAYISG